MSASIPRLCIISWFTYVSETRWINFKSHNNNKRSKSGNNLENLDGRTRPDFMLTGLIPDTGYTISVFAVNPKGQSDRMVLQAYTQKSDQLFETNESALTNMDGFQV